MLAVSALAQTPSLVVAFDADPGAGSPIVTVACSDSSLSADGLTLNPCSSFAVLRSTVSGGPYATIATAPFAFGSTCGTSCFFDGNVAWGTTYYYVATEGAAMSSEIAAAIPPQSSSFDLNGDGTVTIADLLLEVGQVLGVCSNGDFNGDGLCTIADVELLVNAILSP